MEAQDRLRIITEMVRLVQDTRDTGLNNTAYTKPLREVIHFTWTTRRGPEHKGVSVHLRGGPACAEGAETTFDHAIPLCIVRDRLLALDPLAEEAVATILAEMYVVTVVTREEGKRLHAAGM